MRTWDDVAVERGNLVRIPDRVENSSTRDKLEIGSKARESFSPTRSRYVGHFDLCQFSGEPLPHLARMGFHGNIFTVAQGILLVKNPCAKTVVIECGESFWRKRLHCFIDHRCFHFELGIEGRGFQLNP